MSTMFRSLQVFNYRLWFAGALVSNVGTWMQRTAQDWVVLTQLTDHNATAVGITMALQFAPQLVLSPWTGLIADRFDHRKLLMITQTAMALLSLGLGAIVLLGVVELWHVYAFALGLGIASAVDAPVRQVFVSDLVGTDNLSNAVALNSATFSGARLVGPAVAGALTVALGAGWVFVINTGTFAATMIALLLMRRAQLHPQPRALREPGQLAAGFRYVAGRPDILVVLVMVFVMGTFGFNFPIFTATMATVEFDSGAAGFGLLSSIMAVGSVAGALLAAKRARARLRLVVAGAGFFGLACLTASIMPGFWSFGASLILVGLASLTFMTTANAYVQTSTEPAMRGRVMALYMAIFMGGTPIGAPLVGAIADVFGPRWTLVTGGGAGLAAAIIALVWMYVRHDLRVRPRWRTNPRGWVTHAGQVAGLGGGDPTDPR